MFHFIIVVNAVTTTRIVFVKRRVGHLPYEDDKDVMLTYIRTSVSKVASVLS